MQNITMRSILKVDERCLILSIFVLSLGNPTQALTLEHISVLIRHISSAWCHVWHRATELASSSLYWLASCFCFVLFLFFLNVLWPALFLFRWWLCGFWEEVWRAFCCSCLLWGRFCSPDPSLAWSRDSESHQPSVSPNEARFQRDAWWSPCMGGSSWNHAIVYCPPPAPTRTISSLESWPLSMEAVRTGRK